MNAENLPKILTPKDVQEILGWQKDQVYNLFRSKSFPSERIGSKHIIPKARFLRWLGEKEERSQYELPILPIPGQLLDKM